MAAGRALLPGGAALRWNEARWRDGHPDELQLQAEVEPLAIAPLLAQAQPELGWSGDLRLGARIALSARAAHTLNVKQLKRAFACLLYLLAGYMLYKGLSS